MSTKQPIDHTGGAALQLVHLRSKNGPGFLPQWHSLRTRGELDGMLVRAERLAVELRTKLAEFSCRDPGMSLVDNGVIDSHQLKDSSLHELQITLGGLGYEDLEIRRAIRAVASGAAIGASDDMPESVPSIDDTDAWLRASLRWLSQEAA